MRELFKALSELETRLMEQYGVSLNEAMALCCIGGDTLTASVISEIWGIRINGRCILLYPIKGVNVWKR